MFLEKHAGGAVVLNFIFGLFGSMLSLVISLIGFIVVVYLIFKWLF
jgi:hypothetical protein